MMKAKMGRQQNADTARDSAARQHADTIARAAAEEKKRPRRSWNDVFSHVSCVIAHWMGKPLSFLIAALLVVTWAATGPIFNFSDTWQLVINTSTTIITFLMVFLIQNTQNRDTMAIQVKLSELILAVKGAENRFAKAEDMTDEELERLHEELRRHAEQTLGTLNSRRAARQKKAS